MDRLLPYAWLGCTGLFALGELVFRWQISVVPGMMGLWPHIPDMLITVATGATIAGIYLLIAKTVPNRAALILGWGHLANYSISRLAGIWIVYTRNKSIISGTDLDHAALMTPISIGMIFYAIATLLFLIVVLISYKEAGRTVHASIFD